VLNDDKEAVLQKLSHAATILTGKIRPDLYPAGGVQLVYARKGARDDTDIACVIGGLSAKNNGSDPVEVGFGDAGMAATVLLTVMKFDPRILCVAIISCTAAAVKTMDERFFEICSFDPGEMPPGIRTMDWGVAQCCRNGVPDAIYSRDNADTPAIIRLFGEDPLEVANNILMLSA
jgi:thiamine-phosphate diphosphorylase